MATEHRQAKEHAGRHSSEMREETMRQADRASEQMERTASRALNEGWDGAVTLLRANEVLLRGMAAWFDEMSKFAKDRVQHTIETSESLRRCRSTAEALETQREFARETTERYLQQSAKLLNIVAQTATRSLEPVQAYRQEGSSERTTRTRS